jgi:hypothetical protein
MRVLLVDSINSLEAHAAFNSTMVSAVSRLREVTSIHLILDERQLKSLYFKDILQDPKVSVYPVPRERNLYRQWLRRDDSKVQPFRKTYTRFFKVLGDVRPGIIIFLAADNLISPFCLMGLRLKLIKSTSRFFVIFHNNLENIKRGHVRTKRFIWRETVRLTGAKLILLAPFLEPIGRRMIPGADFCVLPHPTYGHLHNQIITENMERERTLDFLFLGRHAHEAMRTGFLDEFLQCCAEFLVRMPDRRISVALPSDINVDLPDGITLRSYTPYPGTIEYLSLIANAKFAVIPSSSGPRLTASGVLADLLTLGTPVIAPDEGAWHWQNVPSNQTFLFRQRCDIYQQISQAMSMSSKEYRELSMDILRHSSHFNIESTSTHLNLLFSQQS